MCFVTEIPIPSLTLVTDRNLYRPRSGKKSDPLSIVEAAIAGGVNIVQLRVRGATENDLALFAVAMRLREMTAGKAYFMVTGDLVLAEKCRADGVLLLERSYKPSEAQTFLPHEGLQAVGEFVRSVNSASRAERGGAHYIQSGPIFDADSPLYSDEGLILLRKIKDAVQIPVIAFGGIQTPDQVVDCLRSGADGVAVTDAVINAPDPHAAAYTLRVAMDAAWRALYYRSPQDV
jgi:thiamine-phosphate pyrophosphorylase